MSPEPSNARFLAIASASALAGFGLVWGALCLRGPAKPPADPDAASVETVTFAPADPDAPQRFDTPVDVDAASLATDAADVADVADAVAADVPAILADADAPGERPPLDAPPAGDRYAGRAVGFRPPEDANPLRPQDDAPAAYGDDPTGLPPDDGDGAIAALDPAFGTPAPPPQLLAVGGAEPLLDGQDVAAPADGPADPLADPSADPLPPAADTLTAGDGPAPFPEDRGDLAASLPPADAPAPVAPAPVAPDAGIAGSRPAAWAAGDAAAPSGAAPLVDPGAPVPSGAAPRGAAAAQPAPLPVMPFAAAPPIGPTPGPFPAPAGVAAPPAASVSPFAPSSDPPGGTAPPRAAPPGATGQGRPGAVQLEGVQTPQLTVEKRGPREIQVGKTARFEILVRNVGSAVANDVVLHDAVPFGTSLVATTPPATPVAAGAGNPGDLQWLLGALPPGGQARVGIDLMPIVEGDVGSVASVTFRADASLRSRATRPALEITAQPAAPVLVGEDSRVSITISNPGSGIATGVVLEAIVPDGLAHRSGRELEFDVGSLPPGEARSIDLVLATSGPGSHGLRLVARADGQIEVAQTAKVPVTSPTLDLAVKMPLRRFLQRPAACTISMANAGTAPAVAVELVAQLPAGMKFVRANNAGYYEERTHRVLWNLEELPAGETGEVEVVLMPVALGQQKILVAARTAAGLSDQIAHAVEVEGLAALAFEVADSEDPVEVGGESEYVIRVANQGTKPAGGVRVVATLLGDLEPVDARGPAPHRVDNLSIVFEPLAKLAPSEEALYRIRVRGRREGDQRVQVQLTSDEQPAPITKEETTRVYADR